MAKSGSRKRGPTKKAAPKTAGRATPPQKGAGQPAAGRSTPSQKSSGQPAAGRTTPPQKSSGQPTAGRTTSAQKSSGQPTAGRTSPSAESRTSAGGTGATVVAERPRPGPRPQRPTPASRNAARQVVPTAPSVLAWAATVGAVLLGTIAFTNEKTWFFGPRATVLMVLAALGLPTLALRAWRSTLAWPARAAIAFLVVAAVSAALSPVPWIGFFGVEEFGTGWLFLLCLAALWALGSELGDSGATLLGRGLVVLGLLNAGATVLEVGSRGWSPLGTFVAHFPGMLFGQGQPTGFADNPVFGVQVMVGGLALLAWRTEERNPWTWWAMTALTGAGVYLSGERFGLIVVVALLVWVLFVRKVRPAITFALAAVGGVVVGVVFEQLVKTVATTQFRSLTTQGGNGLIGPRLRIWNASLHAVAAHPIIGGGPSQADSSTLPYRSTVSVIRDGLFIDVHNFIVEIAVTTGLLGLALFLAWLVPALRSSRGPLLLYAVVVLAGGLIEPFNITSTSLAFLALGAAAVGAVSAVRSDPSPSMGQLPDWTDIAANVTRGVLVVAALFAGIHLMVGNTQLKSGLDNVDPVTLAAASGHLPMWSDAPGAVADTLTYLGTRQKKVSYIEAAVKWNQIALSRNPRDAQSLTRLGLDQSILGNVSAAKEALDRSLVYGPDYLRTYIYQISVALQQGDTASAIHWAQKTHRLFNVKKMVPVITCLQQHNGPQFTKAEVDAACSGLLAKVPQG